MRAVGLGLRMQREGDRRSGRVPFAVCRVPCAVCRVPEQECLLSIQPSDGVLHAALHLRVSFEPALLRLNVMVDPFARGTLR